MGVERSTHEQRIACHLVEYPEEPIAANDEECEQTEPHPIGLAFDGFSFGSDRYAEHRVDGGHQIGNLDRFEKQLFHPIAVGIGKLRSVEPSDADRFDIW